jgi:hypothetical protein
MGQGTSIQHYIERYRGSATLAAVSTRSKVVVVGGLKMFLNSFIDYQACQNSQFFRNIMTWFMAEAGSGAGDTGPDRPVPEVVGTVPPDGARNVPRDLLTIRIQFDRPMQPGARSLTQSGGFGLGGPDVRYDATSHAFSFTRDNPGLLPPDATIAFTVNPDEPAGSGFVDQEGRRAAKYDFRFTTGTQPRPPDQPELRSPPLAQGSRSEPSPADLQLLVTLAPDGKTLSYTLNSPGGDYNFLQLGSMTLQASPREVLQRTFDRLSTWARLSSDKRTSEQTQQAMREVADIGSNLYDELLPDAFKEEYGTLREKYLGGNLWLTSNEPWIPWEIVRPVAYDRRGASLYSDAPLCQSFRLARWVAGAAAPARLGLRRAMLVRPPANLKAAGIESDYFAGLPEVVAGLAVADSVETVGETLAAFSAGQTQLYHFACHGHFDLADPNESRLKLADGFLMPSQLADDRKSGLLRARPLVFVNACHAGERGFGLTRLGGWADRFIAAGASAFIGSLWEIDDALAARFAVEFYNRFFGLAGHVRQPLGQAFREARLVLKDLDPANPTWLAYVLYGNPRAECDV